ncbi:unnamed protein product [Didymodactylos carnosus]|uniref:Intraflagellar transport protein 52-like protein n=1 Tax=Didymodactylos carnosus TaxID=1234261 RepID=A0A814LGC9_9BILA|nr:unnamed protein product [Didymodactylos carnosus]CAF1318724.1 unnamed protein product [Didymodactylos carnosus]CAF3833209.1 unnamed protein product [Didymodactylos carnosus]CAF4128225.1 unnamed protein product [Didymodactylos carnosus]
MPPVENVDEKGSQKLGNNNNNVLFDQSKNEQFSPSNGFKKLQVHLKNWKLSNHREEITTERLIPFRLFVIANPREKFTMGEYDSIKRYIENGGSVLITLNEGGEAKQSTNINIFLKDYGVQVNEDSVIRAAYFKYFYPKEALILDGVLNRAVAENAYQTASTTNKKTQNVVVDKSIRAKVARSLEFVYPFGASLNVQQPSVSVLSTGSTCIPFQRPICSFYTSASKGGGRLCISDYNQTPDLIAMSEMLKCSLHDVEELPKDVRKLLDHQLFNLDLSLVPKMIRSYEDLQVKHEPVSLIKPQFEIPMPPLKPAVYPPLFHDVDPPALELFDLEDYFASETSRLNQLANKCNEQDLEFFVKEFGNIAGISSRIPVDQRDAKHILDYVLTQLFEFKRLNVEHEMDDYEGGMYGSKFDDRLNSDNLQWNSRAVASSNYDRLVVN